MSKTAPLEKAFQKKVRDKLKTLPNTWFEKISDRSKVGIPDFVLCIRGHFIAMELKRSDKEHATPLQLETLRKIKLADGITLVVNPQNWPEVFAEFQRMAKPGEGWKEYK